MKPISAIDAVAPAFRRALSVLAQPFRPGFFLKLVVVAGLSESNLIAMAILLPTQASNLLFRILMAKKGPAANTGLLAHLPAGSLGTAFFVGIGAGVLIYILFCVVFFYLFTRLRFVVFDAVLFGEKRFSRAWAKYGSQTRRYYGLSILAAIACMLMATVIASPIILVSLRMMRSGAGQGSAAMGSIFGYFMLSVLLEYSLIFIAVVIDGWGRDFLMPPMAIEDASIERSFARFSALAGQDPAGIFVFTLLRFVLRMALAIGLMILLIIPVLVLGVILAVMGAVLYHPLWSAASAGIAGRMFFGLYAVIAVLVEVVLYLLAIFTAGGVVSVFTQAYALIFYAGRYPELGSLFNPPPPPISGDIEPVRPPEPLPQPSPDAPPPALPDPPELW